MNFTTIDNVEYRDLTSYLIEGTPLHTLIKFCIGGESYYWGVHSYTDGESNYESILVSYIDEEPLVLSSYDFDNSDMSYDDITIEEIYGCSKKIKCSDLFSKKSILDIYKKDLYLEYRRKEYITLTKKQILKRLGYGDNIVLTIKED